MNLLVQDGVTLWRSRSLLWVMTQRELASRYAGSAMGIAWAYLQPLLTIAAYFLVFDIVFDMKMSSAGASGRVGTYLVVGALPWLAFCESLSRGANSLVEAGSVLQKNALPPVLFVARSVFASLLVFAPLLALLAIVYLPLTGAHFALLAFPLLLLLQCILVLLLAYVLAILTAAVRDAAQVLAFSLSVGIYLSPILFPIELFPTDWRWLLFANPMSSYVLGYQEILLRGKFPPAQIWVVAGIWLMALATMLSILIRRSKDQLVDWL